MIARKHSKESSYVEAKYSQINHLHESRKIVKLLGSRLLHLLCENGSIL